MGFIAPTPGPLPPPPSAAETEEELRKRKREEELALRRRLGRGSTILTAGLGDPGPAPVSRPKLGSGPATPVNQLGG